MPLTVVGAPVCLACGLVLAAGRPDALPEASHRGPTPASPAVRELALLGTVPLVVTALIGA
ncbi:hypothetical protein [Streptomyces sp. x-45]|uniref:hypothetical protein n=1 Tax=Streptomyces sp. x-45 TaxID=2789281 RepID=UPI00397EAC3A